MHYFSVKELFHTDTGLPNQPETWEQYENVLKLRDRLDVIRQSIGIPILISSGFRSKAVNSAVHGSGTSAHMLGSAADMEGTNQKSTTMLADHLKRNVSFYDIDQVFVHKESGLVTFIHVGFSESKPARHQIFEQED